MPHHPEAIVEGKKRPFMGSARYRKQPLCPQLAEADMSQWREIRVLTHMRHWLCTAAIVLMPVSAPIKVLV